MQSEPDEIYFENHRKDISPNRLERKEYPGPIGRAVKILWIPHASWHIPQRAHMFCHALSERHEVHVTDWDGYFSSVRDYLSNRYLKNILYRRSMDSKIFVHGIPRVSPALYSSILRKFNSRVFSILLDRLIQRYQYEAVVSTFVVEPPAAERVIFDLFDHNPAYWRDGGRQIRYADEIEQVETRYFRVADAVVAAGKMLSGLAETRAACPVYWIPNGVEISRFINADGTRYRTKWNNNRPVVGVLGNHDKLEEMVKFIDAVDVLNQKDWTFVIAGRGSALPALKREVKRRKMGNVLFSGPVPMGCAPEVVQSFDVGVCPYRKTPGAEFACPMRLVMYAAAGLPSVCTDLLEVRRMNFSNVILVEDSPDSLAEGIRAAVNLPRSTGLQALEYDLPQLVERYESVLLGRSPSTEGYSHP